MLVLFFPIVSGFISRLHRENAFLAPLSMVISATGMPLQTRVWVRTLSDSLLEKLHA